MREYLRVVWLERRMRRHEWLAERHEKRADHHWQSIRDMIPEAKRLGLVVEVPVEKKAGAV